MINVFVPIVEKSEEFAKFLEENSRKDVMFFVGIRENLTFNSSLKNVQVHKFSKDAKIEEILNSLHSLDMEKGKILIARRPLRKEEFDALISSRKEIASLSAKHGKFVSALKNLAKKIVKRFFAFTFFDDISGICFGEEMFNLIRECGNFSMASRINKYVGVEVEEIETSQKQVKKEYNCLKNNALMAFWALIFVASVVGGVLICSLLPLRALIVVAVVFWIMLAGIFFFVGLLSFVRTISIGHLHFGRAEEV